MATIGFQGKIMGCTVPIFNLKNAAKKTNRYQHTIQYYSLWLDRRREMAVPFQLPLQLELASLDKITDTKTIRWTKGLPFQEHDQRIKSYAIVPIRTSRHRLTKGRRHIRPTDTFTNCSYLRLQKMIFPK